MSGLLQLDDVGNGGGEAIPIVCFTLEVAAPQPRERIKFGAAIVLAGSPLCLNPAFLLELVQGGIERAVADLENVAGDLLEADADGEAVERLESENFEEKKIESALDEVGGFGHNGVLPW